MFSADQKHFRGSSLPDQASAPASCTWWTPCVFQRDFSVTLPCLQPLVSYLALSVKPHGEESVVYSGFVFWLIRPSQFSSVQFSHSVMSDSLWPHESQHARPPCPSPTPGVYSNPCPPSWWCHPTISSSVIPFSSCPQSLPASGLFPISQLCTWGGQNTGVSVSASVLPMNTQDWYPLGWTGWISWQSKWLSRVFSNTTVQKHQFFSTQISL